MTLFLAVVAACGGDKDADPDVADTDADTDADADADADSDTDTDADTDTSYTADTGPTKPVNLLANPGFEVIGATKPLPADWWVFPPKNTNWPSSPTGELIYSSSDTFTAYAGKQSLKNFGTFTGKANGTFVYQEWQGVFAEGDTFELSGWVYTHPDDQISGANETILSVKYFTKNFATLLDVDASPAFSAIGRAGTWTQLTVNSTVPENAHVVQASIEFHQCRFHKGGGCFDAGSVYWDDITFVQTNPR